MLIADGTRDECLEGIDVPKNAIENIELDWVNRYDTVKSRKNEGGASVTALGYQSACQKVGLAICKPRCDACKGRRRRAEKIEQEMR